MYRCPLLFRTHGYTLGHACCTKHTQRADSVQVALLFVLSVVKYKYMFRLVNFRGCDLHGLDGQVQAGHRQRVDVFPVNRHRRREGKLRGSTSPTRW